MNDQCSNLWSKIKQSSSVFWSSGDINPRSRRITHLHFDWWIELCARSGGRRPRDRWRPEEVPGCCVQLRGEFFVRLQLRFILQVPLHLVACLKGETRELVRSLKRLEYPVELLTAEAAAMGAAWLKFHGHGSERDRETERGR